MGLYQVTTKKGKLEGIDKGDYAVFKGIPYAKSPTGDLRFRPPQETEAWEGVRKAQEFSPKCIQRAKSSSFYEKEFYSEPQYQVPMSEDCLYLNIWTPAPSSIAPPLYPVAVWIHGGAFSSGYSSAISFDGEAYCKRGVLLVTINYRLGMWGFLTLPELAEENGDGTCGNVGLLDQIAAIRWVRENIAAFGGDPENITVFGQSAGSMSISVLSCAEETKGLYQHAILQSGGGYEAGFLSHCLSWQEAAAKNEAYFRQFYPDGSLLEQLRSLPAEKLQHQQEETMQRVMEKAGGKGWPEMPFVFSVVKDGRLLKGGLDESIAAGRLHPIDYIIGSNSHDMGCDPARIPDTETVMYQSIIKWSKLCYSLRTGHCYNYFFARKPLGDEAGAFHSCELWYMFGTLDRSWRPKEEADYRVSEEMLCCWTNFMKTGNPSGRMANGAITSLSEDSKEIEWPEFTKEHPYVHTFL